MPGSSWVRHDSASPYTPPRKGWVTRSDALMLCGLPRGAVRAPLPGGAHSQYRCIALAEHHFGRIRPATRWFEVIGATPADHQCLTFLPAPSPLVMWARRQAAEIAVHRYDAEAARGVESTFDPSFASDMLDELLMGYP